jgi:hypothetical protein
LTQLALSQTPSLPAPGDQPRAANSGQAPPLVAFTLAAFSAVIVFLPPEGRIGVPLHDGLALLLGRATFIVPIAFIVTGVLLVVRALRPATPLPRRRLAGTGLIALGMLPSEYLLAGPGTTGLVGRWLGTWLLELLGGPTTVLLLIAVLGLGVLLAFNVRLLRVATGATGWWKDAAS